ncbi:MAG TPA: hypothetical protein VF235_05020 [Actinomycetota bacterium]
MDEYASLAQRVVLTMDDVRGCLVLSRDGLVLAAFPEDEESAVKPAWLKFTHVGDARRSFVEFADQIWAHIHRGPYAAFVVAGTTVRPGVLLDQLEQALLLAEETRAKRETLKVPETQAAPSGRPRTTLHPPTERPQPTEVSVATTSREAAVGPWKRPAVPEPDIAAVGADRAALPAEEPVATVDTPDVPPAVQRRVGPTPDAEEDPGSAPAFEASPFAEFSGDAAPSVPAGEDERPVAQEAAAPEPAPAPSPVTTGDEASEIDRVLLAKEFSGLLQLDADDDEVRS